MNGQEFEKLTRPPEFEINCQKFVEKARQQTKDKYPHLILRIYNETQFQLDFHQNRIRHLKKKGLNQFTREEIALHRQIIHRIDISTATRYLASVDILSKTKDYQRPVRPLPVIKKEIFQAVDDLDQLASQFHGRRFYPPSQQRLIIDLSQLKPGEPNLYYEFR